MPSDKDIKCGYCFGGHCANEDVRPVELRTRPGGKWDGGKTTAGARCREYLRGRFRYDNPSTTAQGLYWCYACRQDRPLGDFWTYKNSKRPHGIQSRCKDCARRYNREVSWPKAKDTKKYKEQWNARNKRSKAKHADRQRARQMVRRRGLKKDACERCGGTDRLQMHHEDYSKPLEVITLCLPCHRAEHKENAAA